MPRRVVRRKKRYNQMNARELAEATGEFDEEFAFLKSRPLTRREQKMHVQARRRGRPRVGMGAEKIRVSIERHLLAQSDAFAKEYHMSRSEMIARGLRAVMAVVGET